MELAIGEKRFSLPTQTNLDAEGTRTPKLRPDSDRSIFRLT
jgi:hypothetical protein